MGEIKVETGDKEFFDSPDTGRPECVCSRCGSKIPERDFALRIFTGKKRNSEYRYCQKCQTKDMGITHLSQDDEFNEPYDGPYFEDEFDY